MPIKGPENLEYSDGICEVMENVKIFVKEVLGVVGSSSKVLHLVTYISLMLFTASGCSILDANMKKCKDSHHSGFYYVEKGSVCNGSRSVSEKKREKKRDSKTSELRLCSDHFYTYVVNSMSSIDDSDALSSFVRGQLDNWQGEMSFWITLEAIKNPNFDNDNLLEEIVDKFGDGSNSNESFLVDSAIHKLEN